MTSKRIFVVDDDPLSREFLTEAVRALGHEPRPFEGASAALAALDAGPPDLVLTDLRMPGQDGIALVKDVQAACPGLPCIVITAHGTIDSAVEAMRNGARDFLLKPCSPDNLELVVDRVLRQSRLERENAYLRSELAGGGAALDRAESGDGRAPALRRARRALEGHRSDHG